MEKEIFQNIADNVEDIVDHFSILNQSSDVLYGSSVDTEEVAFSKEIFLEDIVIGKLVIYGNIPKNIQRAIEVIVDETALHVQFEKNSVEEQSEEHIWRNILLGHSTPAQHKTIRAKYNITKYRTYGLLLLKTVPAVPITKALQKHIRYSINRYIGEQALINTYPIAKGEEAILVEISESRNVNIQDVKKKLYQFRKQLIAELEKHADWNGAKILLSVSEDEYYIDDLPRAFSSLRPFSRLIAKILKTSRLALYEENPIFSILLRIDPDQADAFVQNVMSRCEDQEAFDTVLAYIFNCFNTTKAAESLDVHRHTVEYRLDKCLSGKPHSRYRFEEAVEYYFAYLFIRLFDIDWEDK